MKKLIAGGMAFFCLLLSACGSYRVDNGSTPETVMPIESMMPDPEDGIVKDEDGVIEENEDDARKTTVPEHTMRP